MRENNEELTPEYRERFVPRVYKEELKEKLGKKDEKKTQDSSEKKD